MTGVEAAGELESTRVTRILRDDIILGRRPPGARLVERDIAAELNVSRLPVREAIRTLVSEGIVLARPRTWAVVRGFTQRNIRDFGEVREVVETLAFVFAAERHDDEGIERMREASDREIAAALAGDVDGARIAASEFHHIAYELSDNESLMELISVFVTRMRWMFGQHDNVLEIAREHQEILEAVANRDVEGLKVLIPKHLDVANQEAERRVIDAADPAHPE